jgi:hypothetical protein
MLFAFLALFFIVALLGCIFFGALMARGILPKNHPFQKYLTEDAINSLMDWIVRRRNLIVVWLLLIIFTIITLIYS